MVSPARAFLVESAGTFVWVFLSAAAVLSQAAGDALGGPRPGLAGIALVAGLGYAGLLAVTVPLTGGFLNPAVTLVLWVFHRLDSGRATALAVAQFAGAIAAGMAVRALANLRPDVLVGAHLGTPRLNLAAFGREYVGPRVLIEGMGIEGVLTFAVVFTILVTYFDPRTAQLLNGFARRWANVAVGLVQVAVVLAGYNLTGAATNPARWLGTVVWAATVPELEARRPLADHSVYWVGPTVGALCAGIAYQYVVLPKSIRRQQYAERSHP